MCNTERALTEFEAHYCRTTGRFYSIAGKCYQSSFLPLKNKAYEITPRYVCGRLPFNILIYASIFAKFGLKVMPLKEVITAWRTHDLVKWKRY
jgi:hypothetical protein